MKVVKTNKHSEISAATNESEEHLFFKVDLKTKTESYVKKKESVDSENQVEVAC